MAGSGLLALLDDVTTILDDVAAMSKIAAKKTAGIAGDDLAVNAEGLVGIDPSRELPIVGKVALGSAANKLVLIPLALILPQAVIVPLLMIGGAFLCYEGLHKVLHKKDEHDEEHEAELLAAVRSGPAALKKVEAQKVKQAIITDLVLSAEIVAVALGAVMNEPWQTKAGVLVVVGYGMTIIVYGLVAGIVKLDDLGLRLQRAPGSAALGKLIVDKTPILMRVISVVGTTAMFLVGGGIVLHGVPGAEAALHDLLAFAQGVPVLPTLLDLLATLLVGVGVGAVALFLVSGASTVWKVLRDGPGVNPPRSP